MIDDFNDSVKSMLNGSILVFVKRVECGVSLDDHALLDSWCDCSESAKNRDGFFSNIKFIDNQLVTVSKVQMICKCTYKTI